MENVLIILFLASGFAAMIYLVPQIAKLGRNMNVVNLEEKRYDRNSYSERD